MARGTDRTTFEQQALPHVDALYRTALRMSGNGADAEDLVQETLLKAFRHRDQFEPETNFKAWIFRILTNAYINRYRRRALEPELTDFMESEPASRDLESSGDGDGALLRRLDEGVSDEVKRAIDDLPPEFRSVLLLSAVEDFSYQEIAGIAGIPIGTVMSRLFRARRMLREKLREFVVREGWRGTPSQDKGRE